MINQTEQMSYRIKNLDVQQQKISYQMATKESLQNGSDDSVLYARIVYVDDKIRTYEGLKSQIERTNVQNNASDTSVKDIKKILEYVKQELIKANTSTTTDDGRVAIATSIAGLKENLFQLGNTQVEGEYVFTGSNTSVKPFEKDATTGKISYVGTIDLKKVIVEEGLYKERGVTGLDMMAYSASTAYKGETLNFKATDRIIDQDGNEWKMRTPITAGNSLTFSAGQKILDNNNKIWTLNASNQLEDSLGNINSASITNNFDGTYTFTVPASQSMRINDIVRYDSSNAVVDSIALTGNDGLTPATYSATIPLIDGTKFEAKTNIFDFFDDAVNALNKVDSLGNPISDALSKSLISKSVEEIAKAYDGVNIAHAILGGRNKVFEVSLERVSSKLTQYDVLSQEIASADLTKVAMEAKSLELTYTALYSTISKTNELSLVNFLK